MNNELFEVKIKRKAARTLERLPKEYRLRVLEVLDKLKTNPIPYKDYDIKKLKGFEDTFRVRIGDIRIVYTIYWSSRMITVHFIGPRGRAYK
ncbi:MAG: type II toxin-antitoxin system RelE/ParE family toxin [Staphylothermus sp.]|nr:type II toxin-antitoxin system RelE/ParE family toxin [Staphylothermus sp.]